MQSAVCARKKRQIGFKNWFHLLFPETECTQTTITQTQRGHSGLVRIVKGMAVDSQHALKTFVFCLSMIVAISGCGGGGDDGSASSPNSPNYPSPAVIYSDSFADDSGDWDYEDDSASGDLASWAVVSGALRQIGHLESGAGGVDGTLWGATSYHLGTYARLVNPAVSGSYRFSVDITPLPNIGGDDSEGNDVGIMFGYQSPTNYYRVSMNAKQGFTRFEKRFGGSFETLAIDARGYVENQPMTMAAEINGNAIVVWIDGEPIFAKVDANILSGTVALYCQDRAQFDNVLITENPVAPMVAISSPLAYSVDVDNSFTARAVVLNLPAGGSVSFSRDGGEIAAAGSGNSYFRSFSGVPTGNHSVAAIVRYADGTEAASDTNSMVGTGGDYYVSVGDSITNGVGDEVDSNNDSADGRIVSIQGYQSRLADALPAPAVVFNEGIEGEMASDLENRIDSILERHPGANKVLVLIGTNDSGSGVTAENYNTAVAKISADIVADGKQVWLAEILPTTNWVSAQNSRIQDYNDEILDIATLDINDDIFLGPNLYSAFYNQGQLYYDELHPNNDGYQEMADEWALVLP